MGIASLVCGIVSLVMVILFPIVGLIVGIIGIILGIMAKKKDENDSKAKAGFVCSIIGTVLCGLIFIACAACVGSATSFVNSLS